MQCSHNELETTLRKAVLGAGFSPGTATEVARAGMWLCRCGDDGAGAVVDSVRQSPRPIKFGRTPSGLLLSEVQAALAGPAALDFVLSGSLVEQVELRNVDAPLLLIGMIADAAERTGIALQLARNSQTMTFSPGMPPSSKGNCSFEHLAIDASATLRRAADQPHEDRETIVPTAAAQPIERIEVDPRAWRKILELAALTYVPASDASRLRGAGAGLTDND